MPRIAFNKLSKGKQARVLTYAMAEFEKFPLKDSSMTDIINRSKISRGSLYLYFEDIQDVYCEILRFNIETIVGACLNELTRCTSMTEYCTLILKIIMESYNKHKGYVKNFFVNMDSRIKELLDNEIARLDLNRGNTMKSILIKYQPEIDISSTERLLLFREMVINIMINASKDYAIDNIPVEDVTKKMLAKLAIIEKGFSK